MSHTLGPWEISDRPRKSFASGKLMYRVDGPEIITDYEDWGYTKESARLIAAAPELLEALKEIFNSSTAGTQVQSARAAHMPARACIFGAGIRGSIRPVSGHGCRRMLLATGPRA